MEIKVCGTIRDDTHWECLVDIVRFSDGTLMCKVPEEYLKDTIYATVSVTKFDTEAGAGGLLEPLLQIGYIFNMIGVHPELKIDYLPNGRADRQFSKGVANCLDVFITALSFYYESVNSNDVHGWHPEEVESYYNFDVITNNGQVYDAVVAVDSGAMDRSKTVAQMIDKPIVQLKKMRNADNGNVIEHRILVPCSLPIEPRLLIVDDICDGGYTFISAAKLLKERWPTAKIDLFVSHMIASKGLGVLEEHFENIYYNRQIGKYF